MASAIYYFSGTGNSLKVARELAAEIGNTEVLSITDALNSKVNLNYDKIGFVFPVYMWGLPLIVAEFLKKIGNSPNYLFAVTTFGGFPAATLVQAGDILKSNGIKLSAGFSVKMPGNYAPMYGAIPEGKQRKLFEKAALKIKKIAEIVKLGKENKIEKNNPLVNWLFSKKFYNFGAPHIHEMDKKFWADENCNGCGICQRICPVSNISISENKPKWHNKCQQCMACLQWCPKESIQYGTSTAGRKRYRNPGVKVEDFLRSGN